MNVLSLAAILIALTAIGCAGQTNPPAPQIVYMYSVEVRPPQTQVYAIPPASSQTYAYQIVTNAPPPPQPAPQVQVIPVAPTIPPAPQIANPQSPPPPTQQQIVITVQQAQQPTYGYPQHDPDPPVYLQQPVYVPQPVYIQPHVVIQYGNSGGYGHPMIGNRYHYPPPGGYYYGY